mgnify:CR=1 FL=1
MASACALAIMSGIGFLFGIQKSLRAFLNPLFTSRVVTENGLALSVTYGDTSPKGRGLGRKMNFTWTAKGSHFGGAGANAPERARMLTMCSIPSVSDFYTFFNTYWRVPMPTFSACSRVAFHSMLGLESLKLSW